MSDRENAVVVEVGLWPSDVQDAVQDLLDKRMLEDVPKSGVLKTTHGWLEGDSSERATQLRDRCKALYEAEEAFLEELRIFATNKSKAVHERARDCVWEWLGSCGIAKGGVVILEVKQRDAFGVEDAVNPWRVLRGEVTGLRASMGASGPEMWVQVLEENGCRTEAVLGDLRVLSGPGAAELVPVPGGG